MSGISLLLAERVRLTRNQLRRLTRACAYCSEHAWNHRTAHEDAGRLVSDDSLPSRVLKPFRLPRISSTTFVEFDDVLIPKENLIGKVSGAFNAFEWRF